METLPERYKREHKEKMSKPYSASKFEYVDNRLKTTADIAADSAMIVANAIKAGNLDKINAEDIQEVVRAMEKLKEEIGDKSSVFEEAQTMAQGWDKKLEEDKLKDETDSKEKAGEILRQINGGKKVEKSVETKKDDEDNWEEKIRTYEEGTDEDLMIQK